MAVSSDDKLYCYNEALRILRSRALSSLTEAVERRRYLDSAWGSNNEAVQWALTRCGWNFSMRSSKLEHDPSIEPEFGHRYAYLKPDDVVRLEAISTDEFYSLPMGAREYTDEAGYWLASVTPLYVRYVSDHDDFGMSSGNWPITFKKFIGAHLAEETCERITGDTTLLRYCVMRQDEVRKQAIGIDAMDEGVKTRAPGAWVRSRSAGSRHGRLDVSGL